MITGMDGVAGRAERMLAASRDAVVLVDRDGTILEVGPSAERVVGFSADRLIGRNGLTLLHPDDLLIVIQALTDAVERSGPGFEHLRFRVADAAGRWRLMEAVLENRLDDPELRGLVVTLRDRSDDEEVSRRVHEREDRYRQIAELALEGVWCIDPGARTTFVTQRMAAMLGLQVAEMTGRSMFEFMDPADRAAAEGLLARRRRGVTEEYAFRFRHRSGRELWTRMSTTAIQGRAGEFLGAIALVSDVTEQHLATRRLAVSEARRQAVLDALPDVLFRVSADHVVLDRHAGSDQTPMLAPELYLGRTIREVIPDAADRAEAAVDRALATGEVAGFEFSYDVGQGDGDRFYDARVSRVGEGEAVVLVRDVTDVRAAARTAQDMVVEVQRRRAAEERAEFERRMARAARLEALGRLAGGLAHDMNNLLGVVGNYAAAIRGSTTDVRTAEDAVEIERAVRRGTQLTRRLLMFGRRDASAAEVQDLRKVTAGVCSMLGRTLGPLHRLDARLGDQELWAAVDRWQFEQAVINLVINAQDASEPGTEIEVTLAAVGPAEAADAGLAGRRWLRLSVADHGPGMPPEVQERAFEPFFTTKGPGNGSGLGLAVVHGVATEAGGTVTIATPPSGGTVMSMWLPLVDAPGVPEGGPEVDGGRQARPSARRLLVVDDEEPARRSMSRLLEARGFEVAEAGSGAQALAVLADVADIDAVVTDVVMPGVSGPALADRIRDRFPDLPVVLITGYGAHLVDGVPDDVPLLPKPLVIDDLVATLAELLAPV
jgi:PAS domain S-box-containing protein